MQSRYKYERILKSYRPYILPKPVQITKHQISKTVRESLNIPEYILLNTVIYMHTRTNAYNLDIFF